MHREAILVTMLVALPGRDDLPFHPCPVDQGDERRGRRVHGCTAQPDPADPHLVVFLVEAVDELVGRHVATVTPGLGEHVGEHAAELGRVPFHILVELLLISPHEQDAVDRKQAEDDQ